MDDNTAVIVSNLHKEFILPQHRITTLKQVFVNIGKKNYKKRQNVLDGINFQVNKGDFFGIVGKNGSGKSTLLKILAGVYTPTSGGAIINGNLTPFIELGVGFNPELSGRDNVFLNAALLGFSHKETMSLYNEIVDFAELQDAMDKKLKNYSSGMQVRLAFAIAVKARNEILIFDEVLAVGDEAFQRKCLDVFEQYKAQKQTVILVTHDMTTVKRFCNKALLLDSGKILLTGNPYKVASAYSELNLTEIERAMLGQNAADITDNNLGLKIRYEDKNSKKTSQFKCGGQMRVQMTYDPRTDYQHLVINIYKLSGEHLTGFRIPAGNGTSEVEITARFSKGKYYTLIQAVNDKDVTVGDTVIGPEFIITTDRAPGLPGWSGLVPVDHRVVK